MREGEVLHIPSWVPHQAEALEDTFEIDLFSPIRQDWLDGTDSYFKDVPTPLRACASERERGEAKRDPPLAPVPSPIRAPVDVLLPLLGPVVSVAGAATAALVDVEA